MTQKEALKQLQAYCTANDFALSPSSLPKQTYAIILADGDEGEITTRYPDAVEFISGCIENHFANFGLNVKFE